MLGQQHNCVMSTQENSGLRDAENAPPFRYLADQLTLFQFHLLASLGLNLKQPLESARGSVKFKIRPHYTCRKCVTLSK